MEETSNTTEDSTAVATDPESLDSKCGQENSTKLFEKLMQLCKEVGDLNDMDKIVAKLMKNFSESSSELKKSTVFCKLLRDKHAVIEKTPANKFLHLKHIRDELKAHKKKGPSKEKKDNSSDEKSSIKSNGAKENHPKVLDKNHLATSNAANNENKPSDSVSPSCSKEPESVKDTSSKKLENDKAKKARLIERLEMAIAKLHHRVNRLDEEEIDFDALSDDENSPYIRKARYEDRICKLYKKLSQLKNESATAGRQTLQAIRFSGTKHMEINRAIEKFYNRRREFPNFPDIVKVVTNENKEKSLNFSADYIHEIAKAAFKELGAQLKRRRQYELHEHFTDLLSASQLTEINPADNDPELEQKLSENKKIAETKIEEMVNRYAERQSEINEEAILEADAELIESGAASPEVSTHEDDSEGEAENDIENDIKEVEGDNEEAENEIDDTGDESESGENSEEEGNDVITWKEKTEEEKISVVRDDDSNCDLNGSKTVPIIRSPSLECVESKENLAPLNQISNDAQNCLPKLGTETETADVKVSEKISNESLESSQEKDFRLPALTDEDSKDSSKTTKRIIERKDSCEVVEDCIAENGDSGERMEVDSSEKNLEEVVIDSEDSGGSCQMMDANSGNSQDSVQRMDEDVETHKDSNEKMENEQSQDQYPNDSVQRMDEDVETHKDSNEKMENKQSQDQYPNVEDTLCMEVEEVDSDTDSSLDESMASIEVARAKTVEISPLNKSQSSSSQIEIPPKLKHEDSSKVSSSAKESTPVISADSTLLSKECASAQAQKIDNCLVENESFMNIKGRLKVLSSEEAIGKSASSQIVELDIYVASSSGDIFLSPEKKKVTVPLSTAREAKSNSCRAMLNFEEKSEVVAEDSNNLTPSVMAEKGSLFVVASGGEAFVVPKKEVKSNAKGTNILDKYKHIIKDCCVRLARCDDVVAKLERRRKSRLMAIPTIPLSSSSSSSSSSSECESIDEPPSPNQKKTPTRRKRRNSDSSDSDFNPYTFDEPVSAKKKKKSLMRAQNQVQLYKKPKPSEYDSDEIIVLDEVPARRRDSEEIVVEVDTESLLGIFNPSTSSNNMPYSGPNYPKQRGNISITPVAANIQKQFRNITPRPLLKSSSVRVPINNTRFTSAPVRRPILEIKSPFTLGPRTVVPQNASVTNFRSVRPSFHQSISQSQTLARGGLIQQQRSFQTNSRQFNGTNGNVMQRRSVATHQMRYQSPQQRNTQYINKVQVVTKTVTQTVKTVVQQKRITQQTTQSAIRNRPVTILSKPQPQPKKIIPHADVITID